MTQILHSLNGAVNKLNREKGRRQNGVSDTDCFKNSQGGLSPGKFAKKRPSAYRPELHGTLGKKRSGVYPAQTLNSPGLNQANKTGMVGQHGVCH
jgi:hypothetical protein